MLASALLALCSSVAQGRAQDPPQGTSQNNPQNDSQDNPQNKPRTDAQASQSAPPALEPAQQTILDLTNQDRAAQGLAPLVWNASLATAAAQHALAMAQAGTLSHQFAGEPDVAARTSAAGAHFRAVAENIAYGFDPKSIEQQWMHSTPHRTNILDPRMTDLGVGIVTVGNYLYTVEDFASATPALSVREVESAVEQALHGGGLAILAPDSAEKQDARQACPLMNGTVGMGARLWLHWEGSDLHALPQPLLDAMKSGRFTKAAVGACPALNTRNQEFTAYRVAVLLY